MTFVQLFGRCWLFCRCSMNKFALAWLPHKFQAVSATRAASTKHSLEKGWIFIQSLILCYIFCLFLEISFQFYLSVFCKKKLSKKLDFVAPDWFVKVIKRVKRPSDEYFLEVYCVEFFHQYLVWGHSKYLSLNRLRHNRLT